MFFMILVYYNNIAIWLFPWFWFLLKDMLWVHKGLLPRRTISDISKKGFDIHYILLFKETAELLKRSLLWILIIIEEKRRGLSAGVRWPCSPAAADWDLTLTWKAYLFLSVSLSGVAAISWQDDGSLLCLTCTQEGYCTSVLQFTSSLFPLLSLSSVLSPHK